jgi:hypothetical protein
VGSHSYFKLLQGLARRLFAPSNYNSTPESSVFEPSNYNSTPEG